MNRTRIVICDYNLANAAKAITIAALEHAGDIEGAASLMECSPDTVRHIINVHDIAWPRPRKSAGRRRSGRAKNE